MNTESPFKAKNLKSGLRKGQQPNPGLLSEYAALQAAYDQVIAERDKLRALVAIGVAVVDDFMPNIGKCAIQDYGRVNQFLMEGRKITNRS